MKTGYKGTYNFTCLGHKFEIGQTYQLLCKPILCSYGFHYCVNPIDVLYHYDIRHNFKLLEIEDLSNNTVGRDKKFATDKIRIIREVPKEEYYQLFGIVNNELKIIDENGNFNIRKFDERNNEIHYESSTGYSCNHIYDDRNNEIHFETFDHGNPVYSSKSEYNDQNKQTYFENSNGVWTRRYYDENGTLTKTENGYL
jgi:hypothetical protein